MDEDDREGLVAAQRIVERLTNRRLYDFVGEVLIPPEMHEGQARQLQVRALCSYKFKTS